MREQHYHLRAFETPSIHVSCTAHIRQTATCFEIDYQLVGDLSTLRIPAWDKKHLQQREMGLWEHTCFECFLAPSDEKVYREFNFSPTGAWNAFAFNDYRQDMTVDNSVQCLSLDGELTHHLAHDVFSLRVQFACPDLSEHKPLMLNVTMVLEQQQRQLSYWAIQHPEKPDFHLRTCFQNFC